MLPFQDLLIFPQSSHKAISKTANYFGSQCIVVALDAKRVDGDFYVAGKDGADSGNIVKFSSNVFRNLFIA